MEYKFNTVILTVVILLGISCNENNKIEEIQLSESNILINKFKKSKFNNAYSEIFDLNYNNFIAESYQGKYIITLPSELKNASISRLNSNDEHYVMSILDENNEVIGSSSISGENLLASSESFTGEITQQIVNPKTDEIFSMNITFENGIAQNIGGIESYSENGRVLNECEGYRDILVCTGQKFKDNYIGAEELSCYAAFMLCYFYRQFDCYFKDECQ